MSQLDSYTYEDLKDYFGVDILQKAIATMRSIESLSMSEDTTWATVKISGLKAYRVQVTPLYKGGKLAGFKANCPCIQPKPCEHIAAIALSNLTDSLSCPLPNPQIIAWLESFRATALAQAKVRPSTRDSLCYHIIPPQMRSYWMLQTVKCSISKQGMVKKYQSWLVSDRTLLKPPNFLTGEDINILLLLRNKSLYMDDVDIHSRGYKLEEDWGAEIIEQALATGRMVVDDGTINKFVFVTRGDVRSATMTWGRNGKGQIVPVINTEESGSEILLLDPPWYLDRKQLCMGSLGLPFTGHLMGKLLTIPPLNDSDLSMVATLLTEFAPEIPVPVESRVRVVDVDPVPVLSLGTLTDIMMLGWRSYRYGERTFDYASLSFRYEDMDISAENKEEFLVRPDGEAVRIKRRLSQEQSWIKTLMKLNLFKLPPRAIYQPRGAVNIPGVLYGLDREAAWSGFMRDTVPMLQSVGCEVWIPGDFRHRYLEVEAWEADLHEVGGWFDLELGIVVEGCRLPLAPLIHELLRRDSRWTNQAKIDQIPDDERVVLMTPSKERLAVPAERLKPLSRILIDLFDGPPSERLRFSSFDAPRLADLADMKRWQFKGLEAVTGLAERLKNARGVTAIEPPKGFALQLRPYQLEGLAWLQFLREQQLSGILADDMGLGKTAQALSHLLLEKESGRLDKPALVVLPTSLIFNWRREAEKFAPDLRVLSLQGGERKQNFTDIPASDVVLTTYPLLWRDAEQLTAHEYHLLILDEAQTVKNVTSQAAQVVRKIKARHRLCLTGTPLENHLGELWAQFDFLLPGFLQDSKSFTTTWRIPIERSGDKMRRDLLARRVKPFILRRRKEDVAKELPEKTIIVRSVELEGGQRDLYETVRIAMNEKVREAIAEQGFARSHIVILDALLKLRQVCCDPRLVKMTSARKVGERAKLDLLMDMLPELVNEGRRILVFSQFTSMLSLIEPELREIGLDFVVLTGDTKDRESVIRRFQEDDVPIFLISLKAGGVGLNLTAADTVIHYDPWWNPAVENQATDRVHRIGQTRRVFVYKLIVAGSIEEKILALQEKKAELAAGVLSEDTQAFAKFGEADISALLEALPAR